ncbi:putative DNA helicase [Helianthus annuus]|nr:putative DNA helicase [Helianthus annuus]KAJ0941875.1 putative DNA helicase [Helianthus annuus]
MEEHDQYELVGLDESLEDERDLDQIMADRRAAEMELDARDGVASQRKLHHLLHDQDSCGYLFFVLLLQRFFLDILWELEQLGVARMIQKHLVGILYVVFQTY